MLEKASEADETREQHAAAQAAACVAAQAVLPAPPVPAVAPPLRPLQLLAWLLVAAAAPIMVALLGVFTRYLQITTSPPFPPLRYTATLNLLALPTLLLFHTLPRLLLLWFRRRQQQQQLLLQQGRLHSLAGDGLDAAPCVGGSSRSSSSSSSRVDGGNGSKLDRSVQAGAAGSQAPLGRSLPGLARMHARNPAAHSIAVLLVCAACYEVAILGQNVAPGLVDPAVVMLVSMFAVCVVALLVRLWLKAPLRWALVVPTAAVMIGGAAMVLVPDILAGAGEPGSLTTARAWLGFAASVGAMLGNALFITLAQAFKDADLRAIRVQYTIVAFNLLVILPISLGVDGTDWAAQFGGMDGKDWGALLFCACVAHAWISIMIQESTVRLGGLTVSMFFSLRLIGSVAGSQVILGTTIVQTGVQIAGIVLVCLALVTYTALQWRLTARQPLQQQQATAGPSHRGRLAAPSSCRDIAGEGMTT